MNNNYSEQHIYCIGRFYLLSIQLIRMQNDSGYKLNALLELNSQPDLFRLHNTGEYLFSNFLVCDLPTNILLELCVKLEEAIKEIETESI